jgi:hypothetical protein
MLSYLESMEVASGYPYVSYLKYNVVLSDIVEWAVASKIDCKYKLTYTSMKLYFKSEEDLLLFSLTFK